MKVYSHKYDYKHPPSQLLYNSKTYETVVPKIAIGKIEEYNNKRGAGKPTVYFFMGISSELSNSIQFNYLKSDIIDENGKIYRPGGLREFDSLSKSFTF